MLKAFRLKAKKIGIMNPNTLLEAITKPLNKVIAIGTIRFRNFPSKMKKVKNIKFKMETGFPLWNIPFDVLLNS